MRTDKLVVGPDRARRSDVCGVIGKSAFRPAGDAAAPAAQTARAFLVQFHAEDLPLLQEGNVPDELLPLLGLAKANTELVLDLQCRRPVKTATLDRGCYVAVEAVVATARRIIVGESVNPTKSAPFA